jgi:hypothetical protein
VARTRTTKKLAQRVDLNYFKRPTAFKRAKLWLSVVLPLLALAWIGWHGLARDSRVYSSGRMSGAHAVLERQCALCHVQKAGEFSSKAADGACLACHDAPSHHSPEVASPPCGTCHLEHRGRINLIAAGNQVCAQCHKNLQKSHPGSYYASGIESLQSWHPEFSVFRPDGPNFGRDLGKIKLNHAVHMRPIRRGPNGPNVQLQCESCHHTASALPDLTYSDANYRAAKVSYKESDEIRLTAFGVLKALKPSSGRELMAPVRFADACAGCHSLQFDKRFDFGVPHDTPEVVRAFVQSNFQQYIAVHPNELRVQHDPDRELAGKTPPPEFRIFTPPQWVDEQCARAEELLWRKTCTQCHLIGYVFRDDHRSGEEIERWSQSALESRGKPRPLPEVESAWTTLQWLPHAKFDHDAHRGFSCVSCHDKALTSTETSDILVPGIANCKTCHAPGPEHAESRCFECHTYHDWSKRKEVKATFALPALQRGGR